MLKKIFGGKKKVKRSEGSLKKAVSKGKKKTKTKSKESSNTKKNSSKNDSTQLKIEQETNQTQTDVKLRHRKKKGKKPKFKKIERPKPERDIGKVKKVENKFFPGDVDYKYSSPKENWVSCFGQKQDLDFGHRIRILPDEASSKSAAVATKAL